MLTNFIQNIVKQLVEDPGVVSVNLNESADKLHVTVLVNSADLKRVIGREGRVARALQSCVSSLNPGRHIDVSIDVAP